ncbi:R3H domain protein [Synechococcus sp. PCC 7335]|uniref:R3H domain-containing nucleic acid-binding protein n=1 Tax=Synechococcus sp. (strain ATCC 29403 / PCC 7335) TaxID=91464 RepID=UPI00017EE3B6|nr:R3H domain-containing nucleic acid-binding protein [Synechococcus sp. PCC 7335]EDX86154.1 R3H domain protein [Synechococcus sp. PCC 7335]
MASLNENLSESSASVEPAELSVREPATSKLSKSAYSKPQAVTDDLPQLLEILPAYIRDQLESHSRRDHLIEVVLDLGRQPEARFPDAVQYLSEAPVSKADLQHCIDRVGHFGGDNRAGLEETLHRISAMRNRKGDVIGLTCRVGRAVFGTITMIRDLVETGNSILMLGRPGVGKTTALREIARVLADDLMKRVVIIDTSNEIAGDGDIPHPAIGRARRMQVSHPEKQHQVMIEAVENHMPEVIVIDEIGTELEALAARTIAERGVQLVGTAHGNRLENLIKNPTLSDLVGGIQSVTLGDDEARRRGSQKSVLERKAPPTFDIAVEMLERQRWVVHEDVSSTVDFILRGQVPGQQVRSINAEDQVVITNEMPSESSLATAALKSDRRGRLKSGSLRAQPSPSGWRTTGKMSPVGTTRVEPLGSDVFGKSSYLSPTTNPSISDKPLTNNRPLTNDWSVEQMNAQRRFQSLLDDSLHQLPIPSDRLAQVVGDDFYEVGEDDVTRVYAYGISRQQLDHVVRTLDLPVKFTKELASADAVLALRSHIRNHSKLKQVAKARQLPVYTVKSNSIPQITRSLRRLLDLDDDGEMAEGVNLDLFAQNGADDELEALEEARLAVEQIVIPKSQPVELLPRSPKIRKMQHELAEHYRLKSLSFGDEPNRRLRIYPA